MKNNISENSSEVVETWQSLRTRRHNLILIFYSVIIGIITGYAIVLYRTGLNFLNVLRQNTLADLKEAPSISIILLVIFTFVMIGLTIQWLLNRYPLISGSGIPQVKALLMRRIQFNWLREFLAKFFGGLLSIGSGLSLGREGPAIHLGAQIGEGVNNIFKTKEAERKYLITSGASAGLAAAFNAPLSGVIFSLEELHKFFTPLLLICTLLASICADFIVRQYLGSELVLDIPILLDKQLPTSVYISALVIFGLLLGLCGKLFTDGLVLFQNLYAKVKLNNYYKAVIVVLISLLISLFFTEISLSGHSIIQQIATRPTTLNILLMLLVGKFIFTLFSYSSGFPGGIFLPMLVIGAILGKLYGNVIINIYDISPDYTIHFMILGMAGYLTAVVRAPITGIILILELTGRFDQLFSLTLVATLAYVLTEFVNLEPIYDVLYQRFLSTVNKSTAPQCKNSAKITLLLPVVADSPFDSKFVYQIKWPSSCLLVGIRRDQHEIIPKGNTQILSGDLLIVLTDKNNAGAIQQELYRLGTDTK